MRVDLASRVAVCALVTWAAACSSSSKNDASTGTRDGATDVAQSPDGAADRAQADMASPGSEGGTADAPVASDGSVVRDAAADTGAGDRAADAGAGDRAASDGSGGDGAVMACAVGPTCAPTLGAQIDRMGRAGVNTALTDPFWDDGTRTVADHKAQQDRYNQASNPATWGDVELAPGKKVKDAIKGALAAYDSLDGTSDGTMANDGCGNQLAYGATYKGTMYPDYTLLATVLTDDRLYLNTGSGTCTTYLAVEAKELGVANTDCGGRTPSYNTIDITYSALVTGHPLCTTMCDVSNGVTVDPDKGTGSSETAFPFLGEPTP